jgi:ribosomal protein L11 methyltransferase
MPQQNPTTLARLLCDETTARRLADHLADDFETVAAFEAAGGGWAVELHFADPPHEPAVRAAVAAIAGKTLGAAVTFETLAAVDWIATSLAGLKPVVAGRFTVYGAHDRARVAANRIGIEIEAALAFGTGHHGTTRGCLIALDGLLKERRPRRVLDIGTGTGVLAIAAAKALRNPVLASDIDGEAVAIARENARLNGVAPFVEGRHAAGLSGRRFRERAPFDLVFANILLPPLRRLAAPMARLVAPHGHVILSGLLATQENAALAAYSPHGFRLKRRIPLDEWVTLILVRP